jgi:Coenzyme PQQ synthesis protein D (PqqD)
VKGAAAVQVRYRRADDVVWRQARNGVLVRPLSGAAVITLAGTGDGLWQQLAKPMTIDELAAGLAELYGARPDQVLQELAQVLDDLVDRGVLTLVTTA